MNEPAPADAAVWIRFEFTRHVHAYLQDQIRFSDTKAGVIAAATGILFGAFRQVPLSAQEMFPPRTVPAGLEFLLVALFVVFSLLAVANAYQVLRPRLPERHLGVHPHHRLIEWITRLIDRETPPPFEGDLVNWDAISAHATAPAGAAAYARDVLGKTPGELSRQLSEHSVVLAMIAGQKYQHVRLALNDLLLAAACLVLLTLEIGFSSPP
ncbi:MAG: hypothetical protein M3T56_07445 [Chloroflexota bacterium]|nr:hypothetical protein [Chloroflexota bacterium]